MMLTTLSLLIGGLQRVALAYPNLLQCNDARIELGSEMMGIEVKKGDIELWSNATKYVGGGIIQVTIPDRGLQSPDWFALRVRPGSNCTNDTGVLSDWTNGLGQRNLTEGCANTVVSLNGQPGASTVVWTADKRACGPVVIDLVYGNSRKLYHKALTLKGPPGLIQTTASGSSGM